MTLPSNAIVIDTETTGLSYKEDELLQVSIVRYDGRILFDQFVRPIRKHIWPAAQMINGISPCMVQDCRSFSYYRERVQDIIDSADHIIGFHTNFDIRFLQAAGISFEGQEIIDVMGIFSRAYPCEHHSLINAAKVLGYGDFGAHDSTEDCLATLFCFKAMEDIYIERKTAEQAKKEAKAKAIKEFEEKVYPAILAAAEKAHDEAEYIKLLATDGIKVFENRDGELEYRSGHGVKTTGEKLKRPGVSTRELRQGWEEKEPEGLSGFFKKFI